MLSHYHLPSDLLWYVVMANSELLSAANKQAPGFGCGLLQTLAIHSREFLLLKQLRLVNSGMYLIHFTFKFLFLHII
jgi:hypothetical protein